MVNCNDTMYINIDEEFTIKEITAVARLNDDDPTKIVYLRVKVFILVDQNIPCQIDDFNKGQVNATSVKLIDNMGFDDMPAIGLNVMLIGLTTKTRKTWEIGNREFWVEVHHNANLRYLANKTNTINQSMRSTTALIMGTLTY
ncbi:hypothetical protein C1646_745834 [Rhizophagus diaphanus]|nr:hypothetical protein C1646_745834 [Rhizophagus diaphanus] [Rhizophagus sp. MUCL 43196]